MNYIPDPIDIAREVTRLCDRERIVLSTHEIQFLKRDCYDCAHNGKEYPSKEAFLAIVMGNIRKRFGRPTSPPPEPVTAPVAVPAPVPTPPPAPTTATVRAAPRMPSLAPDAPALDDEDRCSPNYIGPYALVMPRLIGSLPFGAASIRLQREGWTYTTKNGLETLALSSYNPTIGVPRVFELSLFVVVVSVASWLRRKLDLTHLPETVDLSVIDILRALDVKSYSGRAYSETHLQLDRLTTTGYTYFRPCPHDPALRQQLDFRLFSIQRVYRPTDKKIEKLIFGLDPVVRALLEEDGGLLWSNKSDYIIRAVRESSSALLKGVLFHVGTKIGRQDEYQISLDNLAAVLRFTNSTRELRRQLRGMQEDLEWRLDLPVGSSTVTFVKKKG